MIYPWSSPRRRVRNPTSFPSHFWFDDRHTATYSLWLGSEKMPPRVNLVVFLCSWAARLGSLYGTLLSQMEIRPAVAFIPTPSFLWWVGGCFISDKLAARKTRSQTLYLRLLMGGRVTSVQTIPTISLWHVFSLAHLLLFHFQESKECCRLHSTRDRSLATMDLWSGGFEIR